MPRSYPAPHHSRLFRWGTDGRFSLISALIAMALVFSGVAIATASGASAATTGLGTLTKTGKDLTNGSTAVAGGASGTANPGDTLQWVLNYSNTQSTSVNANITDPITGDQAYVPGSLQAPPGMTPQYSTNGGTSYTTTEPASGVNAVGATGTVVPGTTGASSPFDAPTSSFKTSTTGGDGWQAMTYNGNVYLHHHHFYPSEGGGTARQLDCYNLISGAKCSGYSGGGGNITSTSGTGLCFSNGCGNLATGTFGWSYLDPATGKMYFAASIVGTTTFGIQCFDLNTNTSCGFFLNYTGSITAGTGTSPVYVVNTVGLATIGTKLYMLDSNGHIDCFDTATSAACAPPYTQVYPFGTPNTTADNWDLGFYGNVQSFGSSTYVWSTNFNATTGTTYVGCLNAVTNTPCFTAINVGKAIQAPLAPVLNAAGAVIGACLETSPGTANAWTCWNTSGQVMTQKYPQQAAGFVGYVDSTTTGWGAGGVYVSGTKVYMAYNSYATSPGTTTYTCWDWSLNGGAGGSCAGFTNPTSATLNGGTAVDVRAYTINAVTSFPGCLVEDGDSGVLQFFNEKTGAPCTTSTGSASVKPSAYYCDGGSNHVTGWKNFVISGVTSSQYTGATYTVSDANGNPVPGFTGVTLSNTQQVVDLSSIPYSGTTTSLTVSVKLLNADSTAKPIVTLNYSGDPMQVCFKTTVPKTCVATGTTAPDVANAVTTIPGGATDGPTGVSSGTATFTIASPASACALAFTKTADKTLYGPGDTVTYTVTVKNTGTSAWSAANPATFSDDLTNVLANANYNNNATATSGTVSYAAPVLSWSGALAAGATATITYSVTVKSTATSTSPPLTNTVSSSNPNTNCPTGSTDPQCTVTVPPASPSLSLVKSAALSTDANNDAKAGVGDRITFSFVVKNTGTVTLHDVTVADQLVAPAGPAVTVTCPTGDLAPGASLTCTSSAYTVTQADVDAGSVANTATAHGLTPGGGHVPSKPSDTKTPTASTLGMKLVKSAHLTLDANHDGEAELGDQVTYRFAVTNTGSVTLHHVKVDDQLVAPAGPAVAVTCPTSTLAPGTSMTCASSPYTITQADVDAGSVANMATAHGRTPAGEDVPSNQSGVRTPTIGDRPAFGGVARGVLAFTGSNAITLAGLGLLALGLGLGLTFVGRRRRSQEAR